MPTTEIHPLLAVLLAWVVAALASLGGLSGAFLLLPFQVSVLGFTGPAVTPTNHLYNVVAIPAGAWRYACEGRLLWPLAAVILCGSLPGVALGSLARVHWLGDAQRFRIFVGLALIAIGLSSFLGSKGTSPALEDGDALVPRTTRFDLRRFEFVFQGRLHSVPLLPLVLLTLAVGVIGGAYGIGGGALIAPLLVALWRLPVHALAGATLCATCATSAFAVAFFWLLGATGGLPDVGPDWTLGLSFGFGGMLGTYTGARLQRFVRPRWIEVFLNVAVGGLGLAYVLG